MENGAKTKTSIIAEFRLRRWARMNYVSSDQRGKSWNPIVLDEMKLKDQEMLESEDNSMNDRVSSMYVPLAPSETNRIDEAHIEASTPHILKMREASRNLRNIADKQAGE